MMAAALAMTACATTAAERNPLPETESMTAQAETENSTVQSESKELMPSAGTERHETGLLGAGKATSFSLAKVPEYSGEPYAVVNGNIPYFSASELTATSFEDYSELDSLGRCGAAFASIGTDLMPTEERGAIGQVKPSGWHTVKYDCIDGMYLYNRCHLIGYQLAGENANVKNLITGTRYLNVIGMLPFENMVTDYVKETGNHVMYRVTPVFDGNNLVASGVLMEGESVEDGGDGIEYCVFVYNVQPGITVDYATGDSHLTDGETETAAAATAVQGEQSQIVQETQIVQENTASETEAAAQETTVSAQNTQSVTYILNTNTKKFHYPSCSSVSQMKEKNKKSFTGSRDEAIAQGYSSCGRCHP
jgi:DNA-entry nuclease